MLEIFCYSDRLLTSRAPNGCATLWKTWFNRPNRQATVTSFAIWKHFQFWRARNNSKYALNYRIATAGKVSSIRTSKNEITSRDQLDSDRYISRPIRFGPNSLNVTWKDQIEPSRNGSVRTNRKVQAVPNSNWKPTGIPSGQFLTPGMMHSFIDMVHSFNDMMHSFNAAILHQKLAKNGKLFVARWISVKEQHSIKMLK